MTTFDSHPKSKFWSNRNPIKPCDAALNSHKKFWFDCECGHDFEIALNCLNKGNWCSYCANKKLCHEHINCNMCFEKSFASIEKSKNLSNKNNCSAYELLKNSHKTYLFNCETCGHEYEQKLSHFTRGNYCQYCSHMKLCEEENNCKMCYNNSFASIEKSKYWSNKNKVKPTQVFKSTASKYWFDCNKCNNEFETKLSSITSGSWCPKCRYKTEDKLFIILSKIYPSIKTQFKVDWCKNIKHLLFDFVIEERKIIVELDGEQHWIQVAKWKTPEHNRKMDLYKMKCANDNGFSIIRIIQEDVYKNKYDWLNEIISNIEKITNEKTIQNIYMCKNNEYKDFDN